MNPEIEKRFDFINQVIADKKVSFFCPEYYAIQSYEYGLRQNIQAHYNMLPINIPIILNTASGKLLGTFDGLNITVKGYDKDFNFFEITNPQFSIHSWVYYFEPLDYSPDEIQEIKTFLKEKFESKKGAQAMFIRQFFPNIEEGLYEWIIDDQDRWFDVYKNYDRELKIKLAKNPFKLYPRGTVNIPYEGLIKYHS